MVELILGGARSGKTRFAESLVAESGLTPVYLATATPCDEEMQVRIDRHRRDRVDQSIDWHTIEEPCYLASGIKSVAAEDTCVLVDCLTVWLSNCLLSSDSMCWKTQKQLFLETLETAPGRLILVSNEVGYGIVPLGELNRRFVDESGWLHQAIAETAQSVRFIMAGRALELKP